MKQHVQATSHIPLAVPRSTVQQHNQMLQAVRKIHVILKLSIHFITIWKVSVNYVASLTIYLSCDQLRQTINKCILFFQLLLHQEHCVYSNL